MSGLVGCPRPTVAAGDKRQRENIMHGVLAQSGHEPASAIKRAHVNQVKSRDLVFTRYAQ
jgi:hypothetical protein